MIQQKLRKFLTDVVTQWNAGQKMAFFMVLMGFELLNYMVWMLYVKNSAYAQQHVNIDVINSVFPFALVCLAVIIFCMYLFLRFQQNLGFVLKFQLAVMVIYTFIAGYVGYLVGQDNILSAIAISTAGVLIVLFCERRYSYWIVGFNMLMMFSIMYASKSGLLPASPFFVGTQKSLFWVYTYFHLCALKVIIILVLTDNMLYVLKQSYKNTKFLSEHDTLTGLPNRYQTMSYLSSSLKTYHNVGLVMIDLDYFKQVNDNFGHITGDDVLVKVANMLKKTLRNKDLIGRYGGEEFLLVLPNANLQIATSIAMRLHEAFKSLEVKIDTNKILKPTASFGVVATDFVYDTYQSTDEVEVIKHLFEIADASMYYAKAHGRDLLVTALDLPPESLVTKTKKAQKHS